MSELQPGTLFAGYEVLGVIGRGGMGVVHRARQVDLDRPVALKLITPSLAHEDDFRDRFVREARTAAAIDHPNVIPVYSAGEADGQLYIAMRLVDGDDLRTLVRRDGPLEPERAAHVVRQIAGALDAAHAAGVVHRDVKPANVLLDGTGHVYLTDFGLTKRVDGGGGGATTRTGAWVGTLGYVAPEQIRGERVDARTDVYALGCVLHHMLAGEPPYRRDSDEATMWAHLSDPPPQLGGPSPGPALDAVLARALAKDPADRFPSAGDLGRAALAATRGGTSLAGAAGRLVATGAAAPLDAAAVATATTAADPGAHAAPEAPPEPAAAAEPGLAVPDDDPFVDEPSPSNPVTPPTDFAPTLPPGTAHPSEPDPPRHRRALVVLAVLAPIVVLGVVAALLLGSGDDDAVLPSGPTTVAETVTEAEADGPSVTGTFPAGSRPNDVAASDGGRVFVVSNPDSRMTILDAGSGERVGEAPDIGTGAQSVAVGLDRAWVVKSTGSLLRFDPQTGERAGEAISLPAGTPVRVRTGEGAVWVGIRDGAGSQAQVQTVAKVDPDTLAIQPIAVEGGVQDLDVGDDAVWVVNRSRPMVTRIDIESGAQTNIPVGAGPRGIAVGGGSVWVANSEEGSVTQIDTEPPFERARVKVGARPRAVSYGNGAVWVTNELDGTVSRIDPEDPAAPAVVIDGVGRNPAAISARDGAVWVVSPPDGTVARIGVPKG